MKKSLILGAAVAALLAAPAIAADLPVKAPVRAPAVVVPAAYNWTGFYVGGYYATSITHSRANSSNPNHSGDVEINDGGLSVGATAGYNWQFSPNWLVGIEGDFGWLGTKESFADYNDVNRLTAGTKTDWFSTIRGRFGYVTGPSLIYVTGGGAFARVTDTFGATAGPTENTSTRSGWTAGGGIETKLSRSWTATTQYLYVDLSSSSFVGVTTSGAETAAFSNRAHVLKTGFNYKLGDGPFEMFPFFGKPLSSPQRWAGFYAGVNAGGGISLVQVPSVISAGFWNGEERINGTGFAGGGHVGYNWLAFSNWLIGVEGDIGYLGINHNYVDWFDSPRTFGVKTDWYSTVRGRIGTSTGPAFLYGTGGVAFAHVTDSFSFTGGTEPNVSSTRAGWTLGGGLETELTSRWSARLEYLYMNLGSEGLDNGTTHVEFKNRFQVVRAGLTYSFNAPDVISARY
jgi:outer membrane immunogenic protein